MWQALPGGAPSQATWQPPVIRTGTVSAASLAAVAVRRPAHRPAASQAPCVPVRTPPFHIPSAAAAPLRVDRLPHPTRHELSAPPLLCSHTGTGTGLPHGVERRYHPARVWQALSAEPVGELQASALIRPGTVTGGSSRSGITAEGVPSAILTAQACSSAAVAPAAVFQIPSVAAAANCRAPATTPGAGVAAGPPGRGLCAWIHAPARTPAVLTGCHTPRPHSINVLYRAS